MRSLFAFATTPPDALGTGVEDASEAEKSAELKRVKLMAGICLAASALIAFVARAAEPRHAILSYVAAWAEAATVGGLADWYAIVALFRRPLGAPIPHTAVIATNRRRIAEAFGAFVRDQFLKREPIAEKLRTIDFAALGAEWISDERRGIAFSRFALRMLPRALMSIEETGVRQFLGDRIMTQLLDLDLAPIAAKCLSALIEDNGHQKIFDELLAGLRRLLDDERLLETIRERIRRELPMSFSLLRADAYLVRRFLAFASAAIDEAQATPEHPFRRDFDRFVLGFAEKLASSPEYAERANALKRELLSRPEIADLAETLWRGTVEFFCEDALDGNSVLEAQLARFLGEVGRELTRDPHVRAELNLGVEALLQAFIQGNKQEIARFVTAQIDAWDLQSMLRLVELNIGRDLQFIRLNGTMVGGLAGLALYAAERALHCRL
jgi:uncharacterized membrane-anchored protein YjiN (DUF445 family)